MQRVRGSTAKILFPRYNAVIPNIGRVMTCGQVLTSLANAADQAFISSEILGRLGRGRFSRLIVSVASGRAGLRVSFYLTNAMET